MMGLTFSKINDELKRYLEATVSKSVFFSFELHYIFFLSFLPYVETGFEA